MLLKAGRFYLFCSDFTFSFTMRLLFITAVSIFVSVNSFAQKWQPGHFTDIKGNSDIGFIRINPPGRPVVRDEAFIEFRENDKAKPFKLSTSDLQFFVMGRDSFVVAHAPGNSNWGNREFDFVKVVLDEDLKLYIAKAGNNGRGGGFSISPGIGFGIGTGGYGSGFGAGVDAGVDIPLGGGGHGFTGRTIYYYGANTAEMQQLTQFNFIDVMSDIMGDEPDVVQAIKNNQYNMGNIDKLIAYFEKVKASHGQVKS